MRNSYNTFLAIGRELTLCGCNVDLMRGRHGRLLSRRPLLCAAMISMLASGCTSNAEWEQRLMRSGNVRLVSTDALQSLRSGMSVEEVQSSCGGIGRYQFALHFKGSDYLCVSYVVNTSDYTHKDEPYYVLFRDGVMWKTVDAGWEDLPASASVLESGVAVAEVMMERGATPEELRSRFRKVLPPYPEKTTDDYNIPLWLYPAIQMGQWPHMEAMVNRNQLLEDRQNGFAVRLGMTPRQVEQIVGKPYGSDKALKQQGSWRVRIYGQYADLQAVDSREYEARPLMVIYLRNRAVAVLGHDFVPPKPRI